MRGEVLKLREVALDSSLKLAACVAAVDTARDALSLARAEADRAQVQHVADVKAAEKAEQALYDSVAKPAKVQEGSDEEVKAAEAAGLSGQGTLHQPEAG